MSQSKSLQQEDITYLFWLEYGRLRELPSFVADRLLTHGLVCEAVPLKGAQVMGRASTFVQVSQDGLYLIETIRDGRERRFRIPSV